ncbi:MAG: PH domain-containing protein [Alphaproteobacteria bacterium]|nr:PH domain-containing protein [Alphaproteobacteria bacterium]
MSSDDTQFFAAAPLSMSVKVVSGLGSIVILGVAMMLVGMSVLGIAKAQMPVQGFLLWVSIFLVVGWFFALLSIVRSYTLVDGMIAVHRVFWSNRFYLGTGRTAFQKKMPRSWRLFGNGGLFSVSGCFWNREAGHYRAFITDPSRIVWVNTGERMIAISPEDPEAFMAAFNGAET